MHGLPLENEVQLASVPDLHGTLFGKVSFLADPYDDSASHIKHASA